MHTYLYTYTHRQDQVLVQHGLLTMKLHGFVFSHVSSWSGTQNLKDVWQLPRGCDDVRRRHGFTTTSSDGTWGGLRVSLEAKSGRIGAGEALYRVVE